MPLARLRRIALSALLALAILMPGLVFADAVSVRGKAEDGYAEITFVWPTPVPYKTSKQGNKVRIEFSRPIQTSYAGILRTLKDYISDAKTIGGGQVTELTLKGDFTHSGYDSGRSVVIFLEGQVTAQKGADQQPAPKEETAENKPAPEAKPVAPVKEEALAQAPEGETVKTETPAASAPPAPAPASQKELTGPEIGIRTGVHENYTRVVFDWDEKVPYRFSIDKGIARVTFDKPAHFDLAKLNGGGVALVGGARAEPSGAGAAVTLAVPETSKVKHFNAGTKLVLDIMRPTGAPTPVALPAPETPPTEQVAEGPTPEEAEATQPDPSQPLQLKKPDPAPAEAENAPAETDETQAADVGDGKQAGDDGGSEDFFIGSSEDAARLSGKLDIKKKEAPQKIQAVGMRFDWDEPVGAAVFRRAGPLWVVFDKPIQMDVAGLKKAAGNIMHSIEQVPSSRATILRFDTISGVNPNLRRDGLAWILEFRKQPYRTQVPIEVAAQPDSPMGSRLFINIPEPGDGIAIADPEVGDTLLVLPIIPLGHGVAKGYRYPEVDILPTIQGLVVQPWVDDLKVRPLKQGVEIAREAGMHISEVSPEIAANTKLDVSSPLTRIFDLEKWRRGELRDYITNRQRLMHDIAKAGNKRQKEDARLELARFYFAYRFSAETLGVLQVMLGDNDNLEKDPEFRLLRGASNYMMGRFEDARADLNHKILDDNDEGIFWRSALTAQEGDYISVAEELERTGPITRPYPKALKIPMGIVVAEAALETGDVQKATEFLEVLKAEEPNPAQANQLDYVEGRLLEMNGDFDGAIGLWEGIETGPHRPTRAKAAVARVNLLLKLKRIDKAEAARELEKLRFAWRGDEFEFNLLRQLGTLYLEDGNYREGLRTLRQAATYFRDHELAPEITQQMSDLFSYLYLEDGADDMAPVTAIALYDEFKELTPAGARGDEMIRRLADRLVSVDLLDQAAELLEAQVQFRLKDVEKARVGAQLALVYILGKKAEQALQTLEKTETNGLDAALVEQRRHLKARAYIGMGQGDQALALLEGDETTDANLLRTEVYWRQKNWKEAARVLRELLRIYGAKPRKPLDDMQARYVLDLAIAHTLGGNERALARVRQDFGDAMMAGPLKDAFKLISSPENHGLIDYRTVAGKVVDAQNFQAFMAAYKERIKSGSLSAIN